MSEEREGNTFLILGIVAMALIFAFLMAMAISFKAVRNIAQEMAPQDEPALRMLEPLLGRLKAAPGDSETREQLMAIAEHPDASVEQSQRILTKLHEAALMLRDGYEVGRRPAIGFRNMPLSRSGRLDAWYAIQLDGEPVMPYHASEQGLFILDWIPTEPGIHDIVFTYNYRRRMNDDDWVDFPVELSFKLRIVPEDAGDAIEFASSPTLQTRMFGTFHIAQEGAYASKLVDDVRLRYELPALTHMDPPLDFVFTVIFRDSEGNEHVILEQVHLLSTGGGDSPRRVRQRILLPIEQLDFPPGEHRGHIILATNHEAARTDPRVMRAWDGTLEYRTHFIVSTEGRQPQEHFFGW